MVKKIIKLIVYCLILLFFVNIASQICLHKRVYLESPDRSKTVTLYKAFYQNLHEIYIIPYRYEGFLPPKDNYCIKWVANLELNDAILINWYPSDEYYLKMDSYCKIDKLHKNIKANINEFEVIENRKWRFPYDPSLFTYHDLKDFFYGRTWKRLWLVYAPLIIIAIMILCLILFTVLAFRVCKKINKYISIYE